MSREQIIAIRKAELVSYRTGKDEKEIAELIKLLRQ